MKRNDDVICDKWITAGHGLNSLSCSAVTHLDIGDEVKVTGNDADTATVAGKHNGFSGILIYSD